ncbi:hypothetical protein [Methylobacterium flocculans]|uniref:hypothetical protein n=1 Tax=Methylobacterium flocculans TaxID=2984843 RepID=UPI0021F311FF|nr:hypothetical protein [Methylobacterium sp. FF17]
MDRTGTFQDRAADACARALSPADAVRLERSVEDALRIIAAACAERNEPPVKAARRQLAEIYGATRLSRRRERSGAGA